MTRTKQFVKKINVVAALLDLANVSRHHKVQLVDAGYLEPIKVPEAKKVIGSRGRMPIRYDVTKAGANLLRLSKNWAKPAMAATAKSGETQTA